MWNPFDRKRAAAAVEADLPMPEPSVRAPATDIAEVKSVGGVAVATLTTTELTQEAGADQLASLLLDLAETGATHFVLDVQNVQYMDTACLGCLVQALNSLAARGGRIALASLNLNVQSVFKLTRLDRVFPIRADVMSALDAVEGRERE
ncbi:MAG: STAS domain-containing protein [Phycisphaerales bacterium]|nr:STAS domain-containing protein [Phycisphaerales bacterium]NNM25060.1 STAS domain-containing protein [Phycisphaerales bacterium]